MNTTKHHKTRDRTATVDYYTSEQISDNMALTPEGFLLCRDVPIARTGDMIYGPGETPISVGKDGIAHVRRGPEDLLRPETIASFNGKPVADDHPDDDITPLTWGKLSVGVVLNPRGQTLDEEPGVHVIVADLLITNPDAIQAVKDGKREVSAGYDADYEELGEGQGKQTDIIGNHVALVEKGRCGPRCAIRDHHHSTTAKEQDTMATKTAGGKRRVALSERIRKAFRDAEAGMLEDMTELDDAGLGGEDDTSSTPSGGGDGHTHIHIHAGGGAGAPAGDEFTQDEPDAGGAPAPADDPIEARFQSLEQGHAQILQAIQAIQQQMGGGDPAPAPGDDTKDELPEDDMDGDVDTKDELPEKDMDGKMKTNDSAALQSSFQETMAMAEILVPGFRMPTFDSKATRKKTVDTMCQVRKNVLDHAYNTVAGRELIESVAGTKTLDLASMGCAAAAQLFKAAAGAKKLLNNRSAVGDQRLIQTPEQKTSVRTVADLSAAFKAHYKA